MQGNTVSALEEQPPLHHDLVGAWHFFWELNTTRQHNFAGYPLPISFQEIHSLLWIKDIACPIQRDTLLKRLRILDAHFLEYCQKKREQEKKEKPK